MIRGLLMATVGITFGLMAMPSAAGEQSSARKATRNETPTLEVIEPELNLDLIRGVSKLVVVKHPVLRFSITDPRILQVIVFSPYEFEIVGRRSGTTTLTIWFAAKGEQRPVALRLLADVSRE